MTSKLTWCGPGAGGGGLRAAPWSSRRRGGGCALEQPPAGCFRSVEGSGGARGHGRTTNAGRESEAKGFGGSWPKGKIVISGVFPIKLIKIRNIVSSNILPRLKDVL